MEDRAEKPTPSPFLVNCLKDGPQEVFQPFKEWNDPSVIVSVGQTFASIECPKCGSLSTVFEKITSPDNSFSVIVPKGWRYQFEKPQNGNAAVELVVSTLGEPDENDENRAALLRIKVSPGEDKTQPDFGSSYVKLEKTTNVSGVEVSSYKFETPEMGILTSRFSLEGKTYKFRMDYNPELYISKDAEKDYQTILGSFSHRNSS